MWFRSECQPNGFAGLKKSLVLLIMLSSPEPFRMANWNQRFILLNRIFCDNEVSIGFARGLIKDATGQFQWSNINERVQRECHSQHQSLLYTSLHSVMSTINLHLWLYLYNSTCYQTLPIKSRASHQLQRSSVYSNKECSMKRFLECASICAVSIFYPNHRILNHSVIFVVSFNCFFVLTERSENVGLLQ